MCSADGHITEPPDLWTTRLPRVHRESGLRSEQLLDGWRRWYDHCGRPVLSLQPYQTRPGDDAIDWEVGRRLRDLDAECIWAETSFPNLGLLIFNIPDPALAMASARVYNDFLAEAYGPHADRLVSIPIIPIVDVDSAVEEIERVAAAGFRGILLPLVPPIPYHRLDVYERVWAAAQGHHLPVSFHVGTGFTMLPDGTTVPYSRAGLRRGQGASNGLAGVRKNVEPGAGGDTADAVRTIDAVRIGREPQELIAALVGSGTLERFADLHVVSVESNANWLAWTMAALDKAWTIGRGQPDSFLGVFHDTVTDPDDETATDVFGYRWKYPLKPSDYVRRQVHATFMDDPGAVAFRQYTGVECLLWAADYPHPEGTWPQSRDAVELQFRGVTPQEQDAIVGGNLARLYDLAAPSQAWLRTVQV